MQHNIISVQGTCKYLYAKFLQAYLRKSNRSYFLGRPQLAHGSKFVLAQTTYVFYKKKAYFKKIYSNNTYAHIIVETLQIIWQNSSILNPILR